VNQPVHRVGGDGPVHWTITADVEHPDAPGRTYWEVNGDGPDPHDPRHYPTLLAAIGFLISHHMKRGDTLHYAGADTGRILRIGYVRVGEAIEYDVGSTQIANPAQLIEWIVSTIQPGDTISYLPEGS
jgi:hypothetical protein